MKQCEDTKMVSESKVRVISVLGMLFPKADLIAVCEVAFTHSSMHANIYTLLARRWENKSQPAALWDTFRRRWQRSRGLLSRWHLRALGVRALMCLNKKAVSILLLNRTLKVRRPGGEVGFFIRPEWFHPYSVPFKKKEEKKKKQHALRSS